jgi:hypothetical protein
MKRKKRDDDGFPTVKEIARAHKRFKKEFPEDCGWKETLGRYRRHE